MGSKYGAKTVTQTETQMPSHAHVQHSATMYDTGSIGGFGGDFTFNGGYKIQGRSWLSNSAGSGQAMNNVQPTVAALLVIKT